MSDFSIIQLNSASMGYLILETALEYWSLQALSNLNFWNFLQDHNEKPMVFCWMPAVSIYFSDPEGHYLEFIGILPGKTKSNEEKRVVTFEEWLKIKEE